MYFINNRGFPDNAEEESAMSHKGKRGKTTRLYGVYIYRILQEESCEDRPFTTKEISKRILERFGVYIDCSTVKKYLNNIATMPEYDLQGLPFDGYYLKSLNNSLFLTEEQRLDDYAILYLSEYVRNSKTFRNKDKSAMMVNLAAMCFDDGMKNYIEGKTIIHKDMSDKNALTTARLLQDLPEIIENNLVIEIKTKDSPRIASKYRKFCLYATLPSNNSLSIVGTYLSNNYPRIISIQSIEDYKMTEEHFERVQLDLSHYWFLPHDHLKALKNEYPDDFNIPSDDDIRRRQERFKRCS